MSAAEKKQYLSCAETAKLLRQTLKAEFPGTKFSVRSKTYAGGASIRVGWTDGPTRHQVESVTSLYSGATFDGMIDLKSYHDSILVDENGAPQVVSFGADFIFAKRELSQGTLRGIAALIEHLSGEPCDLTSRCYGGDWNKEYPLCVIPSDTGSGLNVMCRYAETEDASTLVHRWVQDKDLRS